MEFLKEFGFDFRLLAAQIVNFLVILFILKRFLYKPVLQMLKKREKIIQEGIQQAEEARLKLEKASEEERRIRREAQNQAIKLIEEAQKQSAEILHQSEEASKKQTEKMIQEARLQIQEETDKAQKKLASSVGDLAVQLLQKALADLFSPQDQQEVMQKAIKRLKH